MENENFRIVTLEPAKVAAFRAESIHPEDDAWKKLTSWAKPKGLMDDLEKNKVYGFNNPNPTKGKDKYGYEFQIQISEDIVAEPDVPVKSFPGGRFACARSETIESITPTWHNLVDWVRKNGYKIPANTQCYEQHVRITESGKIVLDLLLPIE